MRSSDSETANSRVAERIASTSMGSRSVPISHSSLLPRIVIAQGRPSLRAMRVAAQPSGYRKCASIAEAPKRRCSARTQRSVPRAMSQPSKRLATPGSDSQRGRCTSMPSMISWRGAIGRKSGRTRRIAQSNGDQAWGATTTIGSRCATRNMRSRMKVPAVGAAALGNKLE